MESLIIACIDFVLSFVGLIVLTAVLNHMFYLSLFNVGVLPILALLLISFGVASVATVFPVIKTARKNPIDIIKA